MHLSCKISHSVLTLLERQGEDAQSLCDAVPSSMENLRDPSYWLSAHEMELFLEAVLKLPLKKGFSPEYSGPHGVLQKAGHEGANLRVWGVLDSVLRMMPRPQEVFHQPEQFLSYFVSPKPPVENFQSTENSVSFDWPLLAEQYPLVSAYLKAAFEGIPRYIGQPLGQCDWANIHLTLTWHYHQNSFLDGDLGRQLSPDLFKSLIEDLEKNQRENEDLKKQIADLEDKLKEMELRIPLSGDDGNFEKSLSLDFVMDPLLKHWHPEAESSFFTLGQNLSRLHDYMVRAQQLITVLVAQGKLHPASREAMRRVDWDYVKENYPRTVFSSVEVLRQIQQKYLENKEGI